MDSLPLAAILALAWCLYTVASIFVALRLWVRVRRNNQKLNISDGFMSLCWIANAVACVAITYWALIHIKYAKHELVGKEFLQKVTAADQESALKACMAAAFAYYVCLWSLKLSMLFQYFNLFEHLKKYLKWMLSVATALTAILFVVVIVLNLARCLPIKNNWTIMPIEDFCISYMKKDVFLVSTIANVVTDFIVMVLPFFVLHTLPRPIKTKSERIAIAIIVLLGLITMSFSIIRYIRVDNITNWKPENFSMTEVALWTIFELQIAMIAGCLPSLRVLLRDKRNSKAVSKLHEKLDSVDRESGMYSTLKSNYTYAVNPYTTLPSNKHTDSFGYPLAPELLKTVRSNISPHSQPEASMSPVPEDGPWSGSYGVPEYTNQLLKTNIAQPAAAYTPPNRYEHSRNLSTDSTSSTMTSEEVFITMALTPRTGQLRASPRSL